MAQTKKKTTKKTSTTKKPKTIKTSPSKKSTASKKTSSTKRTTTISAKKSVATKKVKKLKIPKKTEMFSYSCIWKIYLVTNPRTNQKMKKRFWIVIGDGHQRYRKFETQLEAIKYFRALKKFAKMRVQSSESKKFVRTAYTYYEMAYNGLDVEGIRAKAKAKAKGNKIETTEEMDIVNDEFASFDTLDYVDTGTYNEEEINKVLAESEGDSILLNEDNFNEEEIIIENQVSLHEKEKTEELPKYETIEHDYKFDIQEEDPYQLTHENVVIEDEKTEETTQQDYGNYKYTETLEVQEEPKQTLYETVEKQEESKPIPVNESNEVIEEPKSVIPPQLDEDIELTQYQTAIVDETVENVLVDGVHKSGRRAAYWILIVLISLIIAVLIAFGILFATGIFNWPFQNK